MTNAQVYRATVEHERTLAKKRTDEYERKLAKKRQELEQQLKALPQARTWVPQLLKVQKTISKYWPLHWPLVEAQITMCATLLLENVTQSMALFTIGPSGSGKSTTLKMFRVPERVQLVYAQAGVRPPIDEQDDFTMAAFLSHYSEAEGSVLEAGALAFVLQHRVMLTSELGPLFRGNREVLQQRFTKLAQILDGEGIRSSSGVHGTLGKKGDFTFVWLGGTTPFRGETWRTMASLGTRLLFFATDEHADECPEELFAQAQIECQEAVSALIEEMFAQTKKRSVPWPEVEPMRKQIRELAKLCAAGQSYGGSGTDEDPNRPSPGHFRQRLMQLACAHAWMHGRDVLTEEDLPMLRHITSSSMPASRGPVLLLMSQGAQTVSEICALSGLQEDLVRKTLARLAGTGGVQKKAGLPTDRWEIRWDR